MRIRPILFAKEVKPKKLVSNPVKDPLRCTDVNREEGFLLLIQISRKANALPFFHGKFYAGMLKGEKVKERYSNMFSIEKAKGVINITSIKRTEGP